MRLSACVTARNRPTELDACLRSLHGATVRPHGIWVSDDSTQPEVRAENRAIVERYERTRYLVGPQAGVCANRNCAVGAVSPTDSELVAFVDDDVCVTPQFIAAALKNYRPLAPEVAQRTILTGVSRDPSSGATGPARLTFRGHFQPAAVPETATVHAAVFPRSFFDLEQWDENIRFGYCMRTRS